MKSKTSYFNVTAFKKDVTRFAPVWGIYLIGMLLILHGILNDEQPQFVFEMMGDNLSVMACANLAYALLTAQVLFGDLFSTRLCNALHAMPVRREGWFLTHLAAGLCFSLVPNLVIAVSFIPALDYYWSSTFFWLLGVQLQYLFFFAVAVFCVFCTGNRFAMAVFYGLLNFLSLMAGGFVSVAYQPLLYGIELDMQWAIDLSPVCWLVENCDWYVWFDKITRGTSECWRYLGWLSGIAVALLGVSVVLYRRRKLECAGDFVAVKLLGPMFHVTYTLTIGMIFQVFESAFVGNDEVGVFMIVGLAVGFFTGRMLLKRTVRVFQWKAFAAYGVLTATVLASMLVVRIDPAGVTRKVPNPEQVCSVTLNNWHTEATLEDAEQISQITQLHQLIIEQRDEAEDYNYMPLKLYYKLEDGSTLYRYYQLPQDESLRKQLAQYFSAPEVVLQYTDWDQYIEQVYQIQAIQEYYGEEQIFTGDEAKELAEVIKQDCLAGTMCQSWSYQGDACSVCELSIVAGENVNYIRVFSGNVNTLQWLEAHGVEISY